MIVAALGVAAIVLWLARRRELALARRPAPRPNPLSHVRVMPR